MTPPSKYARFVIASAYVVRRRRPQITTLITLAASGAIAATTLAGCSNAVSVQAPNITKACEPILASAPITLLSELQRETTPRQAAAIAWGDPAIVLACGVDPASTVNAQVIEVEGVEWIAEPVGEDGSDGTAFTTFGAEPVVQLRVPVDYRPEIDAVVEFSSALPTGVLSPTSEP
jgi:hypothetical protein